MPVPYQPLFAFRLKIFDLDDDDDDSASLPSASPIVRHPSSFVVAFICRVDGNGNDVSLFFLIIVFFF